MKLCLIAPIPPPYGGVSNWEQIVEKELKNDEEVEYSVINIAANKRPADGRTVFDRVFYSGYVMIRTFFKLRKCIKHNRPDVVHMTTSGGLGFYRDHLLLKLLKKERIPSVYHIHFGRSTLYKKENGKNWLNLLKAVRLANHTIVIDHATYDVLLDHAESITEINNPIYVDSFRDYLGRIEKNNIVFIGWVIKAKGIEELIEAFKNIRQKYNNKYKLQIIGPGNNTYVKQLKEIAGDGVDFIGELEHDEAMKVLSEAKLMVLPSYTEGFPNVILEAMSLKKCIIATRVGAIPDMLAGNAGILIEPQSASEIEAALIKVLEEDDNRINVARKGYKRVTELYDVKITIQKYKEVWCETIDTYKN